MVKKVVIIYSDEGKIIGVNEVKIIEDSSTLISLTELAQKNREEEKIAKQAELDAKELSLTKLLNDFEKRIQMLELEQKYSKGEITEQEYNDEKEKLL